MGFYAKHVLPHVIDWAMRNPVAGRLRAEWIPRAVGEVLEVGMGSGLNLPFYGSGVRRIYGLDPSRELERMARARADELGRPVEFLCQPAESPIPLAAASIDTVVVTWTLCSVAEPRRALAEMRRVMKPDGRLIFIEHGLAPDAGVRRWQQWLTPGWQHCAGGCHLDRPVASLLREGGFVVGEGEEGYLPGPRPLMFTYRGVARREAS